MGDIDATAVTENADDDEALEAVRCAESLHDALGMPSWREFEGQSLPGRTYRLEMAIRELRPGDWGFLDVGTGISVIDVPLGIFTLSRFWFGHTWVQIEGALYHEDRSVFAFVERRRFAASFTDTGGLRRSLVFLRRKEYEPYAGRVGEVVQSISVDLLRELRPILTRGD